MLANGVRILSRKAKKATTCARTTKRSFGHKVYPNAETAVADIKDGQTLYVVLNILIHRSRYSFPPSIQLEASFEALSQPWKSAL